MPPILLARITDNQTTTATRPAAASDEYIGAHFEALKHLNHILSKGDDVTLTTRPMPGYRVLQAFAFLYMRDASSYLVPLDPAPVVQAAFNLYEAETVRSRLLRRITLHALTRGIVPPNVHRLYWMVPQSMPARQQPEVFLLDYLRQRLNTPELQFSIKLGPDGSAFQPVIQAIQPDGQVVGTINLSWDAGSNTHVLNNARTLQVLAGQRFQGFDMPCVLDETRWYQHRICVQSQPDSPTVEAPTHFEPRFRDALLEISQRGRNRQHLETNPYWLNLLYRVENTAGSQDYDLLHEGIALIVERLGNAMIPFHAAHGRFSPANAVQQVGTGRLFITNWQHAQLEAPVGKDIFHFFIDTLYRQGATPAQTITALRPDGDAHLPIRVYLRRMHVMADALYALLTLHLVDEIAAPADDNPAFTDHLRQMLKVLLQEKPAARSVSRAMWEGARHI